MTKEGSDGTDLSGAWKSLSKALREDEKYPREDVALEGIRDQEYRTRDRCLSETFFTSRVVTIPDTLFAQYDFMTCRSFMGLMPEINRAWISIDQRLFLWNYASDHEADFHSFDEMQQVIVAVGLVQPAKGIFLDTITHLLVVATPVEIVLLGVGPSEENPQSLELLRTDLKAPADGILFTSIVGTINGRILLLDNEGRIHEMIYQTEGQWFSRKCYLRDLTTPLFAKLLPTFIPYPLTGTVDHIVRIVVDNSRGLLYAHTEQSHIKVFCLEGYTQGTFELLQEFEFSNSIQASITRGSRGRTAIKIVSLHPIPSQTDVNVSLVALTSSGHRLYFAPTSKYRPSDPSTCEIRLVYIRHSGRSLEDAEVHASCYSRGTNLMAASIGNEMDSLITTSIDPVRISYTGGMMIKRYTELMESRPLDGRVWDIVEARGPLNPFTVDLLGPGRGLFVDDPAILGNELYTQFQYSCRQFIVLTNLGVGIVEKLRPVDQLIRLLATAQVQPSHFDQFAQIYGNAEVCAMCIAILCGHFNGIEGGNRSSPMVSSYTGVMDQTRLMLAHLAGRPAYDDPMVSTSSPPAAQPSGAPTQSTGLPGVVALATPTDVRYSARHQGLVLYISRILRPIWQQRLSNLCVTVPVANLSSEQSVYAVLRPIQDQLLGIQEFLESLRVGMSADMSNIHLGDQADAWLRERKSLEQLAQLITFSRESISFLLFLIDHRVKDILAKSDVAAQKTFGTMTFESFVVETEKSQALRFELTKSLVMMVGGDGAPTMTQRLPVDTVSESLYQRCPVLYAQDRLGLIKGNEHLQQALAAQDGMEVDRLLTMALRHYTLSLDQMDLSELIRVTNCFKQKNFTLVVRGTIELALKKARSYLDPLERRQNGLERETGKSGGSLAERLEEVGSEASLRRCYSIVTESILPVLDEATKEDQKTGRKPDQGNADSRYDYQLLRTALSTSTYSFHAYLFHWLEQVRDLSFLLHLDTPSLEIYLESDQNNLEKQDLLWQFYIRKDQDWKGAKIQRQIAQNPNLDISLVRRLEYLARSVGNVRACMTPIGESTQPDTHEAMANDLASVSADLDVAQVQLYLLQEVERERVDAAGDDGVVQMLNRKLLDLTTLYREMAWPYHLFESQLLIYHAAEGDVDVQRVVETWSQLIESTWSKASRMGGDPFAMVTERLCRISRQLRPSSRIFPTPVVYGLLARSAFKHSISGEPSVPGWAMETLMQGGVSFPEAYQSLTMQFEDKTSKGWRDPNEKIYLLGELAVLIEQWLRASETRGQGLQGYRRNASQVQDFIQRRLADSPTSLPISLRNRLREYAARIGQL